MKDKVLMLLKNTAGLYVSGEDISRKLGVTRAAVWKHINALKGDGYIIESSSKKGYRLMESLDILSPGEVLPLLETKYIGREIIYFHTTDSTNNAARQKASEGCREGLVVTAEIQTKGRGRLGRKWTTPERSAIAFSLVLRPEIKPNDAAGITLIMGTAVCRAIRAVTSLDAGIKWPNDIIVNRKKVCGILTEMNAEIDAVNYIIIGVGINVNMDEFPEEINDVATSLSMETGKHIFRKELLSRVLSEFETLYEEFKKNGIKNVIEEFKSYSVTIGQSVRVVSVNDSFEGTACDVTDDGLLIVKLQNGEERKVISGDVSVRGINGYV